MATAAAFVDAAVWLFRNGRFSFLTGEAFL